MTRRGPLLASLALLLVAGACSASPPASETGSAASGSPTPVAPGAGTATEHLLDTLVPARTRQVIRTLSDDTWCRRIHCTVTQAWERRDDDWVLVRQFPSTIGPAGWGKRRRDDGGTPAGVFEIKVTFSTTEENPGRMPWRRRLPTSNVTDEPGPNYNTWLEEPHRTDGDRPSMRYGFVVDYNNVRLRPGAGAAPVPDRGSGIFYHTSRPGKPFEPSDGCTRVSEPADMRWLLTWLRPAADPRVVQNR